jgi:hypothetical protein
MGNIIFVKFRYIEFYDGIIYIANEGCHARITNDLAIIFFVFISIKSLFRISGLFLYLRIVSTIYTNEIRLRSVIL